IRDFHVTGVQTCALPIFDAVPPAAQAEVLGADLLGVAVGRWSAALNHFHRPARRWVGVLDARCGMWCAHRPVTSIAMVSAARCKPDRSRTTRTRSQCSAYSG